MPQPLDPDRACSLCIYWVRGSDLGATDVGECRRHPPTPQVYTWATVIDPAGTSTRQGRHIVSPPMTKETHWCGEYTRITP